jgi:hypothetical protein
MTSPTKDQMREALGWIAEAADDIRNAFPGSKVVYVKSDVLNFEQGIPVNPERCAMVDATPLKVLKEQWKEEAKATEEAHQRRQGKLKSRATGGRKK